MTEAAETTAVLQWLDGAVTPSRMLPQVPIHASPIEAACVRAGPDFARCSCQGQARQRRSAPS